MLFTQNFCGSKSVQALTFTYRSTEKKPGNYFTYIGRKGESIIGKGEALFSCSFRKGQAVCDQIQEEKDIIKIARYRQEVDY